MSVRASLNPRAVARARGLPEGSTGDRVMLGVSILAGVLVVLLLGTVAFEVVKGAWGSITKFGVAFLWHSEWAPNIGKFGAATMLFGTAVTSVIALALAGPVGVAIGIFLALLAPGWIRFTIGPLVEMLAAIPSVILGLWGAIVLAPVMAEHVEPALHAAFGWLGIFGAPQTTGLSVFTAGIVLSVMVVPIIASLSRDLFFTVSQELKDGAEALGATRWEMIRGVVIPSTSSGLIAASMLGLGRALGEAIAVYQVIGTGSAIHLNFFQTGNTGAAQIASQIQFPVSVLHHQSLYYLAVILLVIGLLTNLLARMIARRYDVGRAL